MQEGLLLAAKVDEGWQGHLESEILFICYDCIVDFALIYIRFDGDELVSLFGVPLFDLYSFFADKFV